MAKKITRSPEWYARALKGDADNLGLRETARGFTAADGFNLRKIAELTPAQKRKITLSFHELQTLTAQPKYVYKAVSRKKSDQVKLKQAQAAVQADATVKWKVAFVPHVPKRTKSGKASKPRLYFGKAGLTIKESGFKKLYIPLNPVALVKNPDATIQSAIQSEAPNAQRFTIQAGANEMPVLSDRAGVVARVKKLMSDYNGKKQLPLGSGNAGNAPKHHHWKKWLNGIIGYQFPKVSKKAVSRAAGDFDAARQALQKKRRAAKERARYRSKKR